MEGKYLSKDQRVKIAQQIRKTHFILGDGGNRYNTTSTNFLKNPNTPATCRLDPKLSKELRKSHLTIGNSSNNYRISEFKYSYSPHQHQGLHAEYVKNDLRKHNMILGTTGINYNTTTSVNFKGGPANIQHVKSAQQIERNLRKHHFNLGTDDMTKNSTFGADFVKRDSEKTEQFDNLKQDLTKSHFELGRAPIMMKTTFQHEFTENSKQETAPKISTANLRKEHFTLGNDRQQMSSTNTQFFTAKTEGKQDLNQEKLNDLRSSHFILGKASPSYSLASKFAKPKTASPEVHQLSSGISIRDTHFTLGNEIPD